MNVTAAEALANVVVIAVALHLLCTLALRFALSRHSSTFPQLFAQPILNKHPGGSWILRAKYLLPWVPNPAEWSRERAFLRVLLLGARIGGTVMALALIGAIGSLLYTSL